MEIELELLTTEKDKIRVMEKLLDLARRAKELGFSIKELELETEEDEEEKEIEEETVE
jgi:tetraacyldisaccharide-1-P 4'-kinase